MKQFEVPKAISVAIVVTGIALLALDAALQFHLTTNRLIVWGVPAFLIVAGASRLEVEDTPVARFFGENSYAVYLCHPIFVIGAGRWLGRNESLDLSWPGLALLTVSILVASYAAAQALHVVVETWATDRLRRGLKAAGLLRY